MAVEARGLRDPAVAWLDLNGIVIVSKGEGQRVVESVVAFNHPLTDRVMWEMAIVANGNAMMTGMLPRIEVILHDMAIDAPLGVTRKVAGAFAISEGKNADAA